MQDRFGDVSVELDPSGVAEVEIHRPPANFFDIELIRAIADAYESLDQAGARAIVLGSEGKHFCAGADFSGQSSAETLGEGDTATLYQEAVRLFATQTPVVAAVQGAAIGGGLGLACSADFRVGCPEARFSANFARLGFHQGFGLSVTLPAIVGHQKALEMLYVGRRLGGEEAAAIGLVDRLVSQPEVRAAARQLAGDIAASGPLAVRSIRQTMRGHMAAAVEAATDREDREQERLRRTEDFSEGIRATAERRDPMFNGR